MWSSVEWVKAIVLGSLGGFEWISINLSKNAAFSLPAEWCELLHCFDGNSSFCQVCACFAVQTATSTHHQFIICMFYLLQFHTKQDFVSKDHTSILQFYLQCYLFCFFILGVLLFTPFCREQAKWSQCQFSCWAHTFTSIFRAHYDIFKNVKGSFYCLSIPQSLLAK